jgi:hypothetical protein
LSCGIAPKQIRRVCRIESGKARLKLTDQDPSVELEAVGYAFRDKFKQTMDRFSLFERKRERREREHRAGDQVAQEK